MYMIHCTKFKKVILAEIFTPRTTRVVRKPKSVAAEDKMHGKHEKYLF
jgi:hypothetical protein